MVTHKAKFEVIGFDTCAGFVTECRQKGLNVILSDFVSFFRDKKETSAEQSNRGNYHAIFALASLFHLASDDLQVVLELFKKNLNPDVGVLLTSIPDGSKNQLGSDGRWKLHLSTTKQIELLENLGFEVLFKERLSIYNGNDWIVLISAVKN